MIVFAIDPGTEQSAYVIWGTDPVKIVAASILDNQDLLIFLECRRPIDVFAIEMIASYGMAVGRDVFQTCVWIGRFYESIRLHTSRIPRLVYRRDVKLHHCNSPRAKDANIRQALIDKYGPPGTKKNPGVTYGLKSHLWQAFALATFISETEKQ